MRRLLPRRPAAPRGFTLVEAMTVVIIVGILATLSVIGYRKYRMSARSSEAARLVGDIRAAEEAKKSEFLRYFSSTDDSNTGFPRYYPSQSPGAFKSAWLSPSHPDFNRWQQIGAQSDSPVWFGYAVEASPGSYVAPTTAAAQATLANRDTSGLWYLIQARADTDGNGTSTYVMGTSWTGEIYMETEGE